MENLESKKEKLKNFDFKKFFINMLSFENPADFVLKFNTILSKIILILTVISIIFLFARNLLNNFLFAILLLVFSPLIFIFVKYFLSLYLFLIDWISASTKFYKSNIKKD